MTQQAWLPTIDKSDKRLAIAVLALHHQQFIVNVLGGPHRSSVPYSRTGWAEVQENSRAFANLPARMLTGVHS
jgi:hypothetical protein